MTASAVASHGPDAITVTFQGVHGTWANDFSIGPMRPGWCAATESWWRFDADPVDFRLAEEALRIRWPGGIVR
ncbi:hypothetical protein I546_5920 [Mycobacterium kansasii 732]|nr:hypothetical protein I546_5920 [Mycobacterium kansasii 732]KZS66228.1 hypothetical protein A4G27_11955 [Mycobacterium kansasii]